MAPYLHFIYFLLQPHSLLEELVILDSHFSQIIMRGIVLTLIGFQGLNT